MEWVDEDWAVEGRRNTLAMLTDFPRYVESKSNWRERMAKITEHVVFDIDELVSFGTVKLSSATLEAFKEHLDEKETGHHVGTIALIHSSRAATNARLAAQVVPPAEFDVDPDPEAGARMARGEYFGDFDGHEQKWFKADGTLADDQVLPEDHVETVPLPVDYTAEEKAAMVPGDVPAPSETPEHEWLRREQEAKEHPAA